MTSGSEDSWRLLFDIALSHGESVRLQKLSFTGFNVFLRSADLVGPQTGVFPLLVERLWHTHSRPLSPVTAAALFGASPCNPDDLTFRVVGFEGFTDIMNVVSVRCYQTRKLSTLCGESDSPKCDLREAITLSAEDHVRLEKSVRYTAQEYLRGFIYRNTIHPCSVVSLDPRRSADVWAPHTNQLVRYIVESLRLSVIVPLFAAYSGEVEPGCMGRSEYERFVSDVFPDFTTVQRAGAFAIFDYTGLTDIQELFVRAASALMPSTESGVTESGLREKGCLEDAASESPCAQEASSAPQSPASLRFMDAGKSGGESSQPNRRSEQTPPAPPRLLGLDGFVDAMLMLCVVLFADERKNPRHRAVTAKVWSAFFDHFVPAVGKVKTRPSHPVTVVDPLFTGADLEQCAVTPTLSLVYPQCVPVDHVSSFLISGLALRVDPARCITAAEADNAREPERVGGIGGVSGFPRRLLAPEDPVEESTANNGTRAEEEVHGGDSTDFSIHRSDERDAAEGENASLTFLTGVEARGVGEGNGGDRQQTLPAKATNTTTAKVSLGPVAAQAAVLFNGEFEKERRPSPGNGDDSTAPLTQQFSACHVFVDEEDVLCIPRGPSQAEVLLPPCTWQRSLTLMKLQVSVELTDGSGGGGARVSYTPCRRVPVSLRDPTGDSVCSSLEVTLMLDAVVHTVPEDLVTPLRNAYEEHATTASTELGAAATLRLSDFTSFAVAAGLVRAPAAEDAVRAAIDLTRHRGRVHGVSSSEEHVDGFTFRQALEVVALLPCTRQLGGDAYTVPALVSFLRVACANSSRVALGLPEQSFGHSSVTPYSSPVEVPFLAASRSKSTAAKELAERKENLFRELREARERRRQGHPSADPRRILPAFPSHLSTNPLFTRRLTDRNGAASCAAEQELKGVAAFLQAEFIQHQLFVPPLTTSQKNSTGVPSPGLS